jgi:nitrite reductase/ring-hydroxylating ferredoxin subunit
VRVPIGPVTSVPDDVCVEVGDGRAVVLRVGGEGCAYRNRCAHQDSPLAGGIVRDGVLSCPLHFWRYHARTGQLIGSRRVLERFPVHVVDGQAFVDLPDSPAPQSLREQLLARARVYDRDAAWVADRIDAGLDVGLDAG